MTIRDMMPSLLGSVKVADVEIAGRFRTGVFDVRRGRVPDRGSPYHKVWRPAAYCLPGWAVNAQDRDGRRD